tara:strand:- start:1111 stop:1335 length:225 start_codon:yes stop_codon:yes gene_type:complete
MARLKDFLMDEADNILSVTANKLVGGDISEDDALQILENNKDTLSIIGLEDKYDALAVIYEMTDQLYKDINGEM